MMINWVEIKLVFVVISFALFADILAQPMWAIKVPPGYGNDFFVGTGVSTNSRADASSVALADALAKIVKSRSIKVAVDETISSNITETNSNGKWDVKQIDKIIREIKVTGKSTTIRGLKEVESSIEINNELFEAWVLVSIPKKHPIQPPTKYSAIWRSVLLPGWGQFYKDDTFKGFSFMFLTLSSVTSGFVFSELSKEATNNALSSRTQARRDFFNDQAKQFNTFSTISFISAIVFYTWNIVDATIVKQDNLYVNLESNGFENRLALCIKF